MRSRRAGGERLAESTQSTKDADRVAVVSTSKSALGELMQSMPKAKILATTSQTVTQAITFGAPSVINPTIQAGSSLTVTILVTDTFTGSTI